MAEPCDPSCHVQEMELRASAFVEDPAYVCPCCGAWTYRPGPLQANAKLPICMMCLHHGHGPEWKRPVSG